MAYFAPSYSHDDNDEWLNDLLRDIVQRPEDGSGSGRGSRASRSRSRASRPARTPSALPHSSRLVSPRPSAISPSIDKRTLQSQRSELLSPPRSSWPESERTFSTASVRPSTSSTARKTLIARPAATYQHDSDYSLSKAQSTTSFQSEFSGFAPHPGVRPLQEKEDRSVLGEAAGAVDDNHKYPGPLALGLIIVGICLSVFIISLDRNIITTAIPEITAQFHSYDDIGWYGSAYLLTASAFQPMYGRIYMAFNTKWSYLAAIAIFEVGSLVCAIAPSSKALIVGRAIQGLGSAGILTGSFVVGTHSVRLQARPILFAFVGILYGVGALCGPLLGGAFTDLVNWRWCFWINLPVGGFTIATVFLVFKPQQHDRATLQQPFFARVKALDWIGNIILLGACTMLFLALQYSETRYGWSSALCIGLISGFGVTIGIFIGWMFWKGKDALIPVHIVRQRTVAASCGAAFFIYGALLLHSYYLPIWFQAIKDASALQSGVNMIPYMVVNAFFSLFAGIFVSKNGLFAPPAIIGCAIATVGAGLLVTLKPTSSTGIWAGFEVLTAAGLGMAIQQGFSAVQTALPLHEVPIGTAAVVACQSLGGAIFVSVGNTLLQDHLLDANNAQAIPGVNIRSIIELGATQFRHVVPAGSLPALIMLYNRALQGALIAAVPLTGCAFLCSLCMEWKSVRRQPPTQEVGVKGKEAHVERGLEGESKEWS